VDDGRARAGLVDLVGGERQFVSPKVPERYLRVPSRVQGQMTVVEQRAQGVLIGTEVVGMRPRVVEQAAMGLLPAHEIEVHEQHAAVDVPPRVLYAELCARPVAQPPVDRVGHRREVRVAQLRAPERARRLQDDRVGIEVQDLSVVGEQLGQEHP